MKKAKPKKGFSRAQEQIGVAITGRQDWRNHINGILVDEEVWSLFVNRGLTTESKKVKKAIKRSCSKKTKTITNKRAAWAQKNHKPLNTNRKPCLNRDFYSSDEWRRLRAKVLELYECKCMMCGRSPKSHGIVVHVDHIQPRSKRPDLALNIENLQILCEDCNIGKGNKFSTDWRPKV